MWLLRGGSGVALCASERASPASPAEALPGTAGYHRGASRLPRTCIYLASSPTAALALTKPIAPALPQPASPAARPSLHSARVAAGARLLRWRRRRAGARRGRRAGRPLRRAELVVWAAVLFCHAAERRLDVLAAAKPRRLAARARHLAAHPDGGGMRSVCMRVCVLMRTAMGAARAHGVWASECAGGEVRRRQWRKRATEQS